MIKKYIYALSLICLASFFVVSGCSQIKENIDVTPTSKLGIASSGTILYVKAGPDDPLEDGSLANPYNTLAEIEAASQAGDELIVLYSEEVLDGSIALKTGQELRGELSATGEKPKLKNSAIGIEAYVITLASETEVKDLEIIESNTTAIYGENVTEVELRDLIIRAANLGQYFSPTFTGELYTYNIPRAIAAIHIVGRGDAEMEFEINNVEMYGLGSVGVEVMSFDEAKIDFIIKDVIIMDTILNQWTKDLGRCTAFHVLSTSYAGMKATFDNVFIDNLPEHSDGIYLLGAGKVDIDLNRYVFHDTIHDVGGPLPWGYHTKNGFEYSEITPLNPEVTIKMQNSTIRDCNGTGATVFRRWMYHNLDIPSNVIVDFGGGPLGSIGQNRIYNNYDGKGMAPYMCIDMSVATYGVHAYAKYNYWGIFGEPVRWENQMTGGGFPYWGFPGSFITVETSWGSSIDFSEVLLVDPRPGE
jgi:hypothetical protein